MKMSVSGKRMGDIRRRCKALRPYIMKASENALSPEEAELLEMVEDVLGDRDRLQQGMAEIYDHCAKYEHPPVQIRQMARDYLTGRR